MIFLERCMDNATNVMIAAKFSAFLFGSEVVGVTVTTTISKGDAFTGSLVVEIAFDVGATRTHGHRRRADTITT